MVVLLSNVLCCACLCLNKSIRGLDRNAYVQMALTGEGFVKSGKLAYAVR